MDVFPVFAAAISTAAVFSYLNRRFIKLPTTIGVMVIALAMSLALTLMEWAGLGVSAPVRALLTELDFEGTLLDVMLAFLLFAGALHVDLQSLLDARWAVGTLATVGLLVSTAVVGVATYYACALFGADVPFLHCLVFGSLISPTDPIAVIGMLKSANAPKALETRIAGESLFNDGVAVVLFTVLVTLAGVGHGGAVPGAVEVGVLLLEEVVGAVLLGLGGGYVAYFMLRSIDDYHVEVLITLALAMGLYALAAHLHTSGPLAVVVAGLLIGNTGRALAMSPRVVRHMDTFWELVDEILNVVLFLLIGMEVLVLEFDPTFVGLGLVAYGIVLFARFVSVGGTIGVLGLFRDKAPHTTKILTWAGLRGGISVALALSLSPTLASRDLLLAMTYVVVVVSIVLQGLTVGPLLRRLLRTPTTAEAETRAH